MISGCVLGEVAKESEVKKEVVYTNVDSKRTQGAVGTESKPQRKCGLCAKLGVGGDNHSREWCYVDPKSRAYKPEVRRRRVA